MRLVVRIACSWVWTAIFAGVFVGCQNNERILHNSVNTSDASTPDSDANTSDAGTPDGDASTPDAEASTPDAEASAADGGAPSANTILPADRQTVWKPGLNAVGGIPPRTETCKTLSPSGGGASDTARIQDALDTCPDDQVVKLSAGTFRITDRGLQVRRSKITLRGEGPDQTRLVKPTGTGKPVITIGSPYTKFVEPVSLANDARKGSDTVVLSSPASYAVGEIVFITQEADPDLSLWSPTRSTTGDVSRGWFGEFDRPLGQALEVKSVDGATVRFTTPLHVAFSVSLDAHVVRFSSDGTNVTPSVRFSGVEDLYVAHGEGGDGGGNIHFFGSAYSWLKNVESDKSGGTSVNLDGTFRCEVRDSYIHSTVNPTPGGAGYGLGFNNYAADNLAENNIIWNFNKLMVMRTSGGGNVIGYNYLEDGWGARYPTAPEQGLNAAHMTTAHFELFEGNQSYNFDTDSTWGNAVYIVAFRNHLTGFRRGAGKLDELRTDEGVVYVTGGTPLKDYVCGDCMNQCNDGTCSPCPLHYEDIQGRRAVGLTSGHYYYSFIGNVLGYPGMYLPDKLSGSCVGAPREFVYQAVGQADGTIAPMWEIGRDDDAGDNLTPGDPTMRLIPTLLRDGNYDYVSELVNWDNAPRTIPDSLYLVRKPTFFGSRTWPWVDPIGDPKTHVLPARERFDAIWNATAPGRPLTK